MVALSVNASADRIRARAAALDPVKVAVVLVTLPFFVLGYALRMLWFLASILIAGAQEGWAVCGQQIEARRSGPRGG